MNSATYREYKPEYEQANRWWRALSQMRRNDIKVFTIAQAGIIAFIGNELITPAPYVLALSVIGFFICLIAIKNEKRLHSYIREIRKNIINIEMECSMCLITSTMAYVDSKSTSSTGTFKTYYWLIGIGWLLCIAVNIFINWQYIINKLASLLPF